MLSSFIRTVDILNESLGRAISWLALFMVLVQFAVVLLRYVYGLGWIWLQESIIYMHASVFLAAAGYTLVHNGHVRVDIFYGGMSERSKAIVDLIGGVVFLLPMCGVIAWASFGFVTRAWGILEGSPEGDNGIHGVYLLKSVILVFCLLVALQGLAMMARSILTLSGAATPPSPKADMTGEGV
ncbi:MAG: TRAP transporter small permease subunit [Alphaproteobacteria bacterium]|nr:TRAP transporter small permease subunit [Alphaproteobacteria bacterium]